MHDLRVWGLETSDLGHLIPKDVFSHKSKILVPIFRNRTSFFTES